MARGGIAPPAGIDVRNDRPVVNTDGLPQQDPARASRRPPFLPARMSVRLRLTLLYGGMFILAGGLLIWIVWVLESRLVNSVQLSWSGYPVPEPIQAAWRHGMLSKLLKQLLLALAGVAILAVLAGWLVADRALAPLQRVTAAAQRLSESTLHERINLQGPEDEIKELADTFDAMLARLGHAFDAQRRFVANASHELRTPLAINRTVLEVALSDEEASPDTKALAKTLLANNERHARLIEGLLLLARSERELTTHSQVNLAEAAETVLATRPGESCQAEVSTELMPAAVTGDPVLLEQLIGNLVDNAIKYNLPAEGMITVRTGVLNGAAACQVENTGPVVPAYEIDGLFEPFRRAGSDRVQSAKGAGLGLSIVRAIARAHGGQVMAVPREGGGLIVTVQLPLAAAAVAQAA